MLRQNGFKDTNCSAIYRTLNMKKTFISVGIRKENPLTSTIPSEHPPTSKMTSHHLGTELMWVLTCALFPCALSPHTCKAK
jgi:hypothetical protein